MTNAYASISYVEKHCVPLFYRGWLSSRIWLLLLLPSLLFLWTFSGRCWLRCDFITPQLNFLTTTPSTKRTVENKQTFLGKKRHIMFHKKAQAQTLHLRIQLVCHEFLADNCMVSVNSWSYDLKPCSLRVLTHMRPHIVPACVRAFN